jgi:hypothetical protein
MITSQKVAKNIERFFFVLPSYLICSQIWLNYFLDYPHFGYIAKILTRNPSAPQTNLKQEGYLGGTFG